MSDMKDREPVETTENNGVAVVGLRDDTVIVYLVDIGEGYGGDYNPDDPEDAQLLRIDVYPLDNDIHEMECESICTCIPKDSSPLVLRKAVHHIYRAIRGFMKNHPGDSLKPVMEELSYLSDADFSAGGQFENERV